MVTLGYFALKPSIIAELFVSSYQDRMDRVPDTSPSASARELMPANRTTASNRDRNFFMVNPPYEFGFNPCHHYTAIKQEGYKTLEEGQVVEFKLLETSKGLQALDVTVIKDLATTK